MSRKNRERKQANAERRDKLRLTSTTLPRPERRRLERALADAPTIEEFRGRIGCFSAGSILERLVESAGQLPPFITSRLIHEAVLAEPDGTAVATGEDVNRLANELLHVADPELLARTGTDLSDVVLGRMLPQQMIGQRVPLDDLHRTLAVLAPEDDAEPLSAASWRALLGLDLPNFVIGVMMLEGAIQSQPFHVDELVSEAPDSPTAELLRSTIALLSADLDDLRSAATAEEQRLGADAVRGLGPLTSFPLVRLKDGRVGAPSPAHLESAISTSALYARLARADAADDSRARTEAVGVSFARYLRSYSINALGSGWQVRDLDEGASGDHKRADLALWPEDRSFVVLLEAKATLQRIVAQLRGWDKSENQVSFYQASFDQLDASATNLGCSDGCEEAPTGVPVYGFVVTLEPHLTTVVDGKTYSGIPLEVFEPAGDPAQPQMPSRVISADDFEVLVEGLGARGAEGATDLLTKIVDAGGPIEASNAIRNFLGEEPVQDSFIRSVRDEALERLAASAPDELVRAALSGSRA